MGKYLARLNAIIQEKPLPKEPSKPSKGAFEPFEGDQGRGVSGIERPPEPGEAEHSWMGKEMFSTWPVSHPPQAA
jgi:hypothetical protein